MTVYELLVEVKNPKALDETIQSFKGVVGQDPYGNYDQIEPGVYAVRSVSIGDNLDFLQYVIEKQGYGKVVGKREANQHTAATQAE